MSQNVLIYCICKHFCVLDRISFKFSELVELPRSKHPFATRVAPPRITFKTAISAPKISDHPQHRDPSLAGHDDSHMRLPHQLDRVLERTAPEAFRMRPLKPLVRYHLNRCWRKCPEFKTWNLMNTTFSEPWQVWVLWTQGWHMIVRCHWRVQTWHREDMSSK